MTQIDVGIQGLTRDPVFTYRGPVSTGGIAELRDGPFRGERAAIGISPSNEGWTRALGPIQVASAYIKQGLRGDALRHAIRHDVARQLIIGSSAEMLPNPDNRVTLADGAGWHRHRPAEDKFHSTTTTPRAAWLLPGRSRTSSWPHLARPR